MRSRLLGLCAAALLVSGCGSALKAVANLAENTRTATEQMASNNEISNNRRESKIDPDARSLRQAPPLKLTQRFETREGPDGYMIYDTESHQIARIGSQSQSGLSYEQAQKAQDALVTADSHGKVQ